MRLFKQLVAVAAVALGVGCSGTPAVEDGRIYRKTQARYVETLLAATNVGVYLQYSEAESLPTPSVLELQHARNAVVNSKRQFYYPFFPSESKQYINNIQFFAEEMLTSMGEELTPPPLDLTEEEEQQVSSMIQKLAEGEPEAGSGEEEGGDSLLDDLGEGTESTLSDIMDGVAGAVEALGQAAHNLHGAMLCMEELGMRAFPGTLQVLEGEAEVYNCRAKCVQSSSRATAGWCFYNSGPFLDGGPEGVALRMGSHLTQVCSPIDADDIKRASGCTFDHVGL